MAVLNLNIKFQYSGGTTNEDPNLSLGGQISTATNRDILSNVLHNLMDEVQKSEAVTGEYEFRHFYFRNSNTFDLKNCKLIVLADTTSIWSKLEFAKGTAVNGTVEQAIPNENTAPVGIDDDDWKIPNGANPLDLGEVKSTLTASIWVRRKVEPGALIARNEKVSIRIIGDPPIPVAPPVQCPAGQHYDTTSQTCVDDEDPDDPGTGTPCPDGTVLQNGQCVPIGGPPPPEPVVFAAVGDIGCSTNAEAVLSVIKDIKDTAETQNKAFIFIANGDLSYSSTVDCFVENLDFIQIKELTKISIGNHDDEEDGSSSLRSRFISEFGIPSVGYYSFNIQNIHVLVMDTQSNYGPTSQQFTFAKNDMAQAAADPLIDWIIVAYHKPSMTMSSNHAALTDFREIYHPLFDQYKVDVIIQSHNHNMQQTYPIKYNSSTPATPTIMSTASNNIFTDIDGRIFVVTGAGGRSHYNLSGSRPSHFAFSDDETYGFLLMEWTNNNKRLTCRFIVGTGEEGQPVESLHQFEIVKTTT